MLVISFLLYLFIYLMCVHMYSAHVEVKEQLVGISFLLA